MRFKIHIMKLYKTYIIILFSSVAVSTMAQPIRNDKLNKINSVSTAVPFLTIAPDSRSAGMGDVGVATTPDVYSLHWNPAKYVFAESNKSVALSYSPWLRGLVKDMNLLYLTGYQKIDDMQAIAGSLRYFNMGEIQFYNDQGGFLRNGKPNEFAFDVAYSRLFSENVSAALAFRYIRSDISSGVPSTSGTKAKAGNAFAADLAMYYHSELDIAGKSGTWALGADFSNIGNKMSYSNEQHKTFLPINMRIGGSVGLELDVFNKISFAFDVNKLMVPTPPEYDPKTGEIIEGKSRDVGVVKGIFQSFSDAPGGFKEEMREFSFGFGLEYLYREQFAVRTGYFHENPYKGNRRYFTMGIGLVTNMIGFDFSYLISTLGRSNPMNNTLRFSIIVDLAKI